MRLPRKGAYSPGAVVAVFFAVVALFFYGSLGWTALISFTESKLLPVYSLVGFDQYLRLMATSRWQTACVNLLIFGVFYVALSLAFGTFLAVLLDQKVRGEGLLRTIYLYPFAVSLVVTGLAWRWMLDPVMGLQHLVRQTGWSRFTFDWLVDPDRAIYTLVIAGLWHSVGFVMVIRLAGLRSVAQQHCQQHARRGGAERQHGRHVADRRPDPRCLSAIRPVFRPWNRSRRGERLVS